MTVPSAAAVPTAEARTALCSWVATTTMRAMAPAVALSVLELLVKSSNSETLMPSCAFTAVAASAVLAPVLATAVCTRVVSGLTTAVWSAGAFITNACVTGPWSASTASVPTRARIGYLPASAASTCRITLPLLSVRPEGSPLSQAPFRFLSRQTVALVMTPSMTVTGTLGESRGGGRGCGCGRERSIRLLRRNRRAIWLCSPRRIAAVRVWSS